MKISMSNLHLPVTLLSLSLLFTACDQNVGQIQEGASQLAEKAEQLNEKIQNSNEHIQQTSEALKSGNILSIVADVADMQLKSSEYITQLQETKLALENAIEKKDNAAIDVAVKQLDTQLKQFNTSLESLNLKSQEIDNIRSNMMQANQQLLQSPLLKGEIDLSRIDISALEAQMGSIESEALKLAAMLVQQAKNDPQDSND